MDVAALSSRSKRPQMSNMMGTWDDGVERISTQALFDILEGPQRRRNAGARRRLAKIMRELGWTAIKARGLTPGGFRDQIRGWARDKRQSPWREP
jgi:hypothetical protein